MPLKLVRTTGACPEQHDVFDESGRKIGYMRLRHGSFRAEYLGTVVYTCITRGDGGLIHSERIGVLNAACQAIEAARAAIDVPLEEQPLFEFEDRSYDG